MKPRSGFRPIKGRHLISQACMFLASVGPLIAAFDRVASADEKVYRKTVQSTVWIVAKKSTGSGILVDRMNRLIVTNEHVVDDAEVVTIFFPHKINHRLAAQRKYYMERIKTLGIKGKVIAKDIQRDIAIVQLSRLPDGVPATKFGKPASPGAEVHSIGNPSDSDALWVYTSGQVRANYYRTFSTSKRHRMQVLETQSPINPGDSGGPIVNNQGELVGISQSFSTKGRLISHGVDISEISWFLEKVKRENKSLQSGKPSRPNPPSSGNANSEGFARRKVDVGSGNLQTVMVANEIEKYRKIQTRRIWSLAKSFPGDAPHSATLIMLKQNSITKIGGWVLEKGSDGKTHVIFLAHANVNGDDEELDSVVDYVGKVTAAMKKQLK